MFGLPAFLGVSYFVWRSMTPSKIRARFVTPLNRHFSVCRTCFGIVFWHLPSSWCPPHFFRKLQFACAFYASIHLLPYICACQRVDHGFECFDDCSIPRHVHASASDGQMFFIFDDLGNGINDVIRGPVLFVLLAFEKQ